MVGRCQDFSIYSLIIEFVVLLYKCNFRRGCVSWSGEATCLALSQPCNCVTARSKRENLVPDRENVRWNISSLSHFRFFFYLIFYSLYFLNLLLAKWESLLIITKEKEKSLFKRPFAWTTARKLREKNVLKANRPVKKNIPPILLWTILTIPEFWG